MMGPSVWPSYAFPNPSLSDYIARAFGGEGGILIRRLRKPKKPNEIRLRQRAGSDFVTTLVYHFSEVRKEPRRSPDRRGVPRIPRFTTNLRARLHEIAQQDRSGRHGRPILCALANSQRTPRSEFRALRQSPPVRRGLEGPWRVRCWRRHRPIGQIKPAKSSWVSRRALRDVLILMAMRHFRSIPGVFSGQQPP